MLDGGQQGASRGRRAAGGERRAMDSGRRAAGGGHRAVGEDLVVINFLFSCSANQGDGTQGLSDGGQIPLFSVYSGSF